MTTSTTAGTGPAQSIRPVPHALLAAGSIAGPTLLTLATALDWTGDGAEPLDYLAKLSAHPGVYLASGMLLVVGMALLPVTAIGLFRASAGRERATLLRVGAVLLATWGVLGVGGVSVGYTAGWVAADLVGVVSDDIVRQVFLGITYSPWGTLGGGVGGAAFALGMLATGIGAILARGLPRWPGPLVLAALAVAFTGGPLGIHWINAGGFLLLAVAVARLTAGAASPAPDPGRR